MGGERRSGLWDAGASAFGQEDVRVCRLGAPNVVYETLAERYQQTGASIG